MEDPKDYHLDQYALEHARPDRLTRALQQERPRFESARQFGFFCSLVIDEWQSSPGLRSWMGSVMEVLELGARVQTSYDPSETAQPPAYHLGWILRVLRGACELESEPIIQAWGQCDILGRTQRSVADDYEISASTLHGRLTSARAAIYSELVREGAANREPRPKYKKNPSSGMLTG